jgi:hypothetical protein
MALQAMSVVSLWIATAVLLLLWLCIRPGDAHPTYADILLGIVLVVQVLICVLHHRSESEDR